MKINNLNKSTYRTETRPIHLKNLQFNSVNGQDYSRKCSAANFENIYLLCLRNESALLTWIAKFIEQTMYIQAKKINVSALKYERKKEK